MLYVYIYSWIFKLLTNFRCNLALVLHDMLNNSWAHTFFWWFCCKCKRMKTRKKKYNFNVDSCFCLENCLQFYWPIRACVWSPRSYVSRVRKVVVLLVGEQFCLVNSNINIVKNVFKLVILTHQISLQCEQKKESNSLKFTTLTLETASTNRKCWEW